MWDLSFNFDFLYSVGIKDFIRIDSQLQLTGIQCPTVMKNWSTVLVETKSAGNADPQLEPETIEYYLDLDLGDFLSKKSATLTIISLRVFVLVFYSLRLEQSDY